MILRHFLIGCGTAVAIGSSALAQTPSESFLKSSIVLSYPSGYGGMGYDVQHLVDVLLNFPWNLLPHVETHRAA
jgi:hypothetical protein